MKRAVTVWGEFGGGGKTTISANTAAALGRSGDRVLAIDLDPQPGGLTDHVGATESRQERDQHIGDAMLDPEGVDVRDLIVDVGHFDLIPSHEALANTGNKLNSDTNIRMEQFQLQTALQPVYDAYDYIIIDPQASLNLLVDNALVASRNAIIPIELSRKGLVSVQGFRETVGAMESEFKRLQDDFSIDVLAVVPNCVEGTNIEQDTRAALAEMDEPVTDFEIRKRSVLQYAWDDSSTVFRYINSNDDSIREYERDVVEDFKRIAAIVRRGGLAQDVDPEGVPA